MIDKNKRDRAIEYFAAKMHCSQAVLAAFSEECGISEEQAFRLGSCFGSGMRKGEVCGACTGALMVLGLLYGQKHIGDPQEREISNRINDMMMSQFEKTMVRIFVMIFWDMTFQLRKGRRRPEEKACLRSFAQRWLQVQ